MKKMRHVALILIMVLACFSAYARAAESDPAPAGRNEILQESLKQPSAHLPVNRYEFTPVVEGQEIIHDFVVQNKGSATLEIQKVKTDWGCTAVSYTRQIPPGGEGKVTLRVSTNHKGGQKILKSATVYTNDIKNPQLKLSILGDVEKIVTMRPRQLRLRGMAGEEIKGKVTIIPAPKYPFKIVKARARDGKDISFQLSEEKGENGPQYALVVENKRLQKGSYFDIITLETDSKIRPELQIRIYGELQQQPEEKELNK